MQPSFRPSSRLRAVAISPILELSRQAGLRRAQGADVIDLTVGEPDFDTPAHIQAAAVEAMRRGQTKYTPLVGAPDLIEAITARTRRDVGLDFDPRGIIACTGAKQVINNALAATLDEGDEVILPEPCWASYADIVRIEGGKAVGVPGRFDPVAGWRPDIPAIEAAITPRTRWILINSPSNPTGAVIGEADLRAFAAMLDRHPDVWVMCDEIYAQLVYDGARADSLLKVAPSLASRTLIVNGVSKAYAMTGWRLGWGVGPRELIGAMTAVQSQTTSAPCSISQAAAVAALNGPQDCVEAMRVQFERRRNILADRLSRAPRLTCPLPQGAFYMFPTLAEGEDDQAFSRRLLEQSSVAVVPGVAFAAPGSLRLSFALGEQRLIEAADRIVETLAMKAA